MSGSRRRRRLLLMFVVVAALSVVLDQASKQWAHANLRGGEPLVVFPGLLEFDYAFNPGAAFGMFSRSGGARPLFIVVTLAALAYIVVLVRRMPDDARAGFVALALMTGGALGNLIDRLVRIDEVRLRFNQQFDFDTLIEHPTRIGEALAKGRSYADIPRHGVIDFIVVNLGGERHWPAFNLADASLVVGVGLLALTLIRHGQAVLDGSGGPERPQA